MEGIRLVWHGIRWLAARNIVILVCINKNNKGYSRVQDDLSWLVGLSDIETIPFSVLIHW
jgi:hypothetical protein